MSFLDLFIKPALPLHVPATRWGVPLSYPAHAKEPHTVTAFWEDMPKNCYNCGAETKREETNYLWIEGEKQAMNVIQYCPNGCGFTEWIA